MTNSKKMLIIKHGALGDVVRTSFFAKPVRTSALAQNEGAQLYWLTSEASLPLLRFNPFIDVVTTNPADLQGIEFDVVYSLDDETEVLSQVANLRAAKIVGASFDNEGKKTYCEQSAYWFDMGLLSKFGKKYADAAKRENRLTHSEIFKAIFDVNDVDLTFYNSGNLNSEMHNYLQKLSNGKVPVGLNAFAGQRWPSKALLESEFHKLVQKLSRLKIYGRDVHLFLIGSGADHHKNQYYSTLTETPGNVTALNTDDNVLNLAAAVRSLKLLITTDSLCLHLATGQKVPTVAFFSPTSAAEIENLRYLRKLTSLSSDYCSYKPDADNSTITCDRIIDQVAHLLGVSENA